MKSVPITVIVMSSIPVCGRHVLDSTLCDKVCLLLAIGRFFFSPDIPLFTINKTDRQEITKIFMKVTLNTTQTNLLALR
jgi:hypothetical protein